MLTIPFRVTDKTAKVLASNPLKVRTIRWDGKAELVSLKVGNQQVLTQGQVGPDGKAVVVGLRSPFQPPDVVVGAGVHLELVFTEDGGRGYVTGEPTKAAASR